MNWAEGANKLRILKNTELCCRLVQGDILNAMLDELGAEMKALKKQNRNVYEQMGGRYWCGVALGQAATELDCGVRQVGLLRQVASCYPPLVVPREPEAPANMEARLTWSFLARCTRFPRPWEAVQYGMAHDWSYYDYDNAVQVGDQYVVESKEVMPNTRGTVQCPKCGEAFTVRGHTTILAHVCDNQSAETPATAGESA